MRVKVARSYIDERFNVPGQVYPDSVHVDAPVGLVEIPDELLRDWQKAHDDLWAALGRLMDISEDIDGLLQVSQPVASG